MTASEELRSKRLASIKREVEDAKVRLLKRGNAEISSMIKKFVSQQVKVRVKAQVSDRKYIYDHQLISHFQIEKRMREVKTQLQGDAQATQRRATLANV
jgi:hypothetical protein